MSTKRKAPTKFAQPALKQSAKQALKSNINESNTAVSTIDTFKGEGTNGVEKEVIEIPSDSPSSEYESSDDEKEDQPAIKDDTEDQKEQIMSKDANLIPMHNGEPDTDMASPNLQAEGELDQEPTSPTFGDLVRAHETIEVPATLSAQNSTATAPGKSIAPPSLASLGTVLSQALRTDDSDLLESCLHTTDLMTIRNTIQRLGSSLAGALLTKLASRMHRRPGRAGSLMAWVQWTLIAHGGALATQPALVKTLSELNKVLEERSRGLAPLLALKGKLDLLDAQVQLRRSMRQNVDSDDEADGEEGIVYVDGEESDVDMVNGDMNIDDDEVPVTNGIAAEDSENDDEFSEDDDSDDELEGAEEPIDENEVDHDDVEPLSDDDDSEVEAAPPTKKAKKGRR